MKAILYILHNSICALIIFFAAIMLSTTNLVADTSKLPNTDTIRKLYHKADEMRYNDPEGAKQIALQAAWLANLTNNKEDILKTQRLLASIYWLTSQYDSALFAAKTSLELSDQLNNATEKANTLHTMGIVYRDLGDPDRAVSVFFEALTIFEDLNDKNGISRLNNSIGILFADQNDNDRAKEYYARSLLIAREIGDLHGIARGLNNLALLENQKGSIQTRKQYLLEALKINQQTGQKLWEGINYLNLGEVYHDEALMDSAFVFYHFALKQFEELRNIPQIVSALLRLSTYHEAENDLVLSLHLAESAMKLSDSARIISSKITAAQRLSEINNLLGDEIKALRYNLLSYQLQDSINTEESTNRIRMIEMLNEYDKTLQAKKLEQQKKETTYLIIILTILFVSILAVFMVLARMKLNRKSAQLLKKDLQAELERKNKELTISVMTLMKKNELISDITKRLNESYLMQEKKDLPDLRAILRDLKRSGENEIWEDFNRRFTEVHSSFYQQLTQQFPTLTPNDLRLCAFLRMNLSSKEISELTGQRVPSIDIARSRLRKKLGIAHSEVNLTNFLSQI